MSYSGPIYDLEVSVNVYRWQSSSKKLSSQAKEERTFLICRHDTLPEINKDIHALNPVKKRLGYGRDDKIIVTKIHKKTTTNV